MDASGAPEIVRKLWNDRPVIDKKIDAKLHVKIIAAVDRSWSDRSFKGDAEGTLKSRIAAAENVMLARDAVSSVAIAHGAGFVLAAASMSVGRCYSGTGASPTTWTSRTSGRCEGLDFARQHAATIIIGRMELPIAVVDGLVAALTYDDECPEEPMDWTGDGRTKDGWPLRPAMAGPRHQASGRLGLDDQGTRASGSDRETRPVAIPRRGIEAGRRSPAPRVPPRRARGGLRGDERHPAGLDRR